MEHLWPSFRVLIYLPWIYQSSATGPLVDFLILFQSVASTDPKLDGRLDRLHSARADSEHPDTAKIQPFRKVVSSVQGGSKMQKK